MIKVTGAPERATAELVCENEDCGYRFERTISFSHLPYDYQIRRQHLNDYTETCPNCESTMHHRQFSSGVAPSSNVHMDEKATHTLSAKQDYFRSVQRKSDDDVRHKHGVNYDDALNSAAAQRIKKKLGGKK